MRENGRVVVMFCAFEGPPRIVRLHGRGEYVLTDDPRFDELLAEAGFEEPTIPEARRAIVLVDVTRIGDSCGYGVPLMDYAGERPHMDASTRKRVRVARPGRLPRLPGRAQRERASTASRPSPAEHRRSTLLVRMTIQGGRCVAPVSIPPA